MAFTAQEQRDVWRAMLDKDGALSTSFSKADLSAAVANMDAWLSANQASAVAQLPEPFKSTSNATQKALLLAYVCLKRAGVI